MKMRYFAPNTHTLDSWLHSQKNATRTWCWGFSAIRNVNA